MLLFNPKEKEVSMASIMHEDRKIGMWSDLSFEKTHRFEVGDY